MEKQLVLIDSNDRPFDDVIIYYGYENFEDIDMFKFRNHIYKARSDKGRVPRNGQYCMPEELATELYNIDGNVDHMHFLNKNFRNVQYIMCGEKIYWVYCLNSDNLTMFKFIGFNLSYAILEKLLTSAGMYLGYIHDVSEYTGSRIEVWYNPNKMVLATFGIDGDNKLVRKKAYMRKFEKDHVIKTSDTSCLFERSNYSNVPLMEIGEYDEPTLDGVLPWTKIVNMADDVFNASELDTMVWKEDDEYCDYKYSFLDQECLTCADFEEDSKNERFNPFYYDEMLTILFNKGSSKFMKKKKSAL